MKDQLTGTADVQYCSTHHNHQFSLGHLRIPHETRIKIAAQLQQGVIIERIIDKIRDSTMEGATRDYLVTKQDVHNVKNQYNIEGVMRYKNYLSSCSITRCSYELSIGFFLKSSRLKHNHILSLKMN